ncbi:hypothetical protein OEZ85_008088 [Tetradesmus obliquus]|uniref:Uncharacterized protein n=1 Tax=Tetradesmus obliquus TaxID=3088 RepID=A0ABY8TK40_TETOB|nr:hypothetical protein OEZ85_008088 [Tetradesmus obliquus]
MQRLDDQPHKAPRPSLHACPVALRPFARHTAAPLHTPCFARFAHDRASLQAQEADQKLIELTQLMIPGLPDRTLPGSTSSP